MTNRANRRYSLQIEEIDGDLHQQDDGLSLDDVLERVRFVVGGHAGTTRVSGEHVPAAFEITVAVVADPKMDAETRKEILQGEPRYFASHLLDGWIIRDGITGEAIPAESERDAEQRAAEMSKRETEAS